MSGNRKEMYTFVISWHILCGFIQQLCRLPVYHSRCLFPTCLSLPFIFRLNVTVADKATSDAVSHSGVVCLSGLLVPLSPVDGVEFMRSASQLGLWCVWSCLSIKHSSMHLPSDSSIVAVNCAHVGDGEGQGGKQRRQRWIHYRCQFTETCQCSFCRAAVRSLDWLD